MGCDFEHAMLFGGKPSAKHPRFDFLLRVASFTAQCSFFMKPQSKNLLVDFRLLISTFKTKCFFTGGPEGNTHFSISGYEFRLSPHSALFHNARKRNTRFVDFRQWIATFKTQCFFVESLCRNIHLSTSATVGLLLY